MLLYCHPTWLPCHVVSNQEERKQYVDLAPRGGGGVLAEKLGRGVRPTSQNPYPIYDQNLRFSLPYLKKKKKFDTLFMT